MCEPEGKKTKPNRFPVIREPGFKNSMGLRAVALIHQGLQITDYITYGSILLHVLQCELWRDFS